MSAEIAAQATLQTVKPIRLPGFGLSLGITLTALGLHTVLGSFFGSILGLRQQ